MPIAQPSHLLTSSLSKSDMLLVVALNNWPILVANISSRVDLATDESAPPSCCSLCSSSAIPLLLVLLPERAASRADCTLLISSLSLSMGLVAVLGLVVASTKGSLGPVLEAGLCGISEITGYGWLTMVTAI